MLGTESVQYFIRTVCLYQRNHKKPNLFALVSSSQMSSCNRISFFLSLFSVRVGDWYSGSWSSHTESASHSVVSNSLRPHALYSPWNSPGQSTEVAVPFFRRSSQPRSPALQADSLLAELPGSLSNTEKFANTKFSWTVKETNIIGYVWSFLNSGLQEICLL